MANNLRKFNTYSDYEAAELVKPAVSLIADTDEVYFDQKATFNGLTVYYNITDTSQPTKLFNVQSGSGSGSGGALPSAMIIDGTAVEVTNTYQFSTTGEHIVQYSIENPFKKLPNAFLDNTATATKVIIGDYFEKIGYSAFTECSSLTSITSNVMTAPTIDNSTFQNVGAGGTLTVPSDSQGYCDWMTYLSDWTIEGVTCGGSGSGSGSGA